MSSEEEGMRYDVVMDNDYRMTRLTTGETELYSLNNDPHEFTNLLALHSSQSDEGAKNPEYAEVIEKLSQHLSFSPPKPGKDGWLEAEALPTTLHPTLASAAIFTTQKLRPKLPRAK